MMGDGDVKRAVVILGSAAMTLAGGLAGTLAVAAPASACPYGTVQTSFSGVCTGGIAGGGPQAVPPPGPSGPQVTTPIGGGIPSVNGIPCTQDHLGTCIALTQSG
jgi:hypothetical protein